VETSQLECHRCGHRNEPQARECEQCGAPLAKHCPRCGARLELAMRFCDRCGANHAQLSLPDGRCHWCGFQSKADSEVCERCGARLITACPRCKSEMKAGLNYCCVCGLDYQGLIADQDDQEE
jgi:ribosomal protein L40E